jgi:hypothetical protein
MDKEGRPEREQILFLGLNNKKTLVLIGSDQGFRVVNFLTVEVLVHRQLSGGIGPIDCLETSNILAMTGGGLYPYYPQNKLIIWDDAAEKIKAEIVFKQQEINNIKFKYEYLFVLTDYKIYIYSFFENLTLKKEVDTIYNPKGLFETNSLDEPSYFAHLNYADEKNTLMTNKEEGIIWIYNLSDFKHTKFSAHITSIKCMKFNYRGNYFATASEKVA